MLWSIYIILYITHYIDVIMTMMASQITSLTVVYSIVYSDADQRKHQSSASLAFVWGIHRDRWISRTKGQLRGKCFHLMTSSWICSRNKWSCTHNENSVLISWKCRNWQITMRLIVLQKSCTIMHHVIIWDGADTSCSIYHQSVSVWMMTRGPFY